MKSTLLKNLLKLFHYCQHHGLVIIFCSSGIALPVAVIKLLPSAANSIQTPAQQQLVSLVGYERLDVGMSLTDAQANLGRPATEVSRDETLVTYKWTNSDGSMITADFKNNRLISKRQSDLK